MDMSSEQKTAVSTTRWTVHIEVRVQPRSTTRFDTIRSLVFSYITSSYERITLPSVLDGWEDVQELASSVERIVAAESVCSASSLSLDEMALQIHVYQPSDTGSFEEYSNMNSNGVEDDDTMAATVCELPNRSWEGLWDSLIYADNTKMKLLDYIHATLLLSDADVDFNLVSWNRVVLLHGPPGTGKTSLCRALAQKLSIRLSHRYPRARLLEINSHSLFSKWFSESGKLVQRLFSSITELVEDDDAFVVVLIDEVESLTAARAGAMAGTEPSDGLRVVNALLTQLDKLKHRKNVLILSTSNLVKAIDCAFVDRADIIQYIDLPPREAIYDILRTSLCEIIAKGIISPVHVPTLKEARMYELSAPDVKSKVSLPVTPTSNSFESSQQFSMRLLGLAAECRKQGMSGRALRRLPVLALAQYIGVGGLSMQLKSTKLSSLVPSIHADGINGTTNHSNPGPDVEVWLDSMEKVIQDKAAALEKLA